MVEYALNLDSIFGSLADPTRRDILRRVAQTELSIGDIAKPYNLTLAAISKHLRVLETAQLITKHRRGKQQFVQASPEALHEANKYLQNYQKLWDERFNNLEQLLSSEK